MIAALSLLYFAFNEGEYPPSFSSGTLWKYPDRKKLPFDVGELKPNHEVFVRVNLARLLKQLVKVVVTASELIGRCSSLPISVLHSRLECS